MTLRRALLVLVGGSVLTAAGLLAYGARVRDSGEALISQVARIRSAADAERDIADWRARSRGNFTAETSPADGDRSYDVRISNGLLHVLHIVPPTLLGATITMRGPELRTIILVMYSGRRPDRASGVWVQEWFSPHMRKDVGVNPKGRPRRAVVVLSSDAPKALREKAFSLNAGCLVKAGGCTDADAFLPGVWKLDAASQAGRHPRAGG